MPLLCSHQFILLTQGPIHFSQKNIESWRFWKMQYFWVGHHENQSCSLIQKIFFYSIRFEVQLDVRKTFTQSICTHFSNLSGQPDIFLESGTFKKSGTLLFSKSRVQKNGVIVIQKEKRPGCLFSFWITMTLVFCTLPAFFKKPGARFFCRVTNRPWFSKLE